MAAIVTTSGKAIKQPSRDTLTIYAPDGSPHVCAPVDAMEILRASTGYTTEPPEGAIREQQSEQQSVNGDAAGIEAAFAPPSVIETVEAQTGGEVLAVAQSKIKGRKK